MPEELKPTSSAASREQQDEELIQAAFQKLLNTYLASNHRRKVDVITKAFNFAKQAHKGVRRLSGEPYILHPIAVAQIACEEIGLGSTSICAALLHDVEEDTDYSNEDISNLFGPRVANIVEGVTKISGTVFGERTSQQAETIKKLLLTMSDDIRVILIKISDRLHNMRTLESMRPSKQYKIAGETLFIYAPIADRLGLNKIKSELENLSFKYEHREEHDRILQMLEETQPERDKVFEEFTPPICEALDKMGLKYHIKARIKTPYSIWQKMQNKQVDFTEIFDILAIRIIFTPRNRDQETEETFAIYGAIAKIYTPHPKRLRDWVSKPKANGYQALHGTFMGRDGRWIEVQIRSDRMDDMAEEGFAAHWKYKDNFSTYDENGLDRWLNSIKEILDDPQPDTLDFLDTIKLNLFGSEILVFTPKGELKTMPKGSTVLDFAFSIHSALGTHCFAAKVNHHTESPGYVLKSGDQVEILTSADIRIKPEWLSYAYTAKARGKIQAILRREDRRMQREGEVALHEFLRSKDFEPTTPTIDRLTRFHGFRSHEAYFLSIGKGQLTPNDEDIDFLRGKRHYKGWKRFVPFIHDKSFKTPLEAPISDDFASKIDKKRIFQLTDEVIEKCHIATCCHPIPGDDALGYITPDRKLELHKRSCKRATELKMRDGNNIIATDWKTNRKHLYETRIYITGVDSSGVLYAIAEVFNKLDQFPIHRITLDTKDGLFEGHIDISVHDTNDVAEVCKKLNKIENISKAYRG
ncbi:MAG: bifunctional (p)ppGpp synthetase/guanosine-3',5'-bis(diphosphate) 3'-pyrophosphohydrolase [Bacteroidaceae bacterium]|nr:bifunctional (p)ppGpp synthetase/guanosine-3',5'-bis(diphosphate) 3'-pyrophosphohydrolase [Bacteroidaceae bacterium]